MSTLIVYYSHTGTTHEIVEILRSNLSCDIERISLRHPLPPRGWRLYLLGGYQSIFRRRPPLNPLGKDPSLYDTVILGFPVWAGHLPSPMRSLLSSGTIHHRRCAIFCSYAGNPGKALEEGVRLLEHHENRVVSIAGFREEMPSEDREQAILSWAETFR
ncbi:hypothetical protein Spith_0033 [Spirochaeta thermophila DSM 6578]|uniref:Flavodoxin n=1 Tax=Winmispira thermophila (strain ATCC 700085 / DSM 6578 / Z-1203) TaxID=869211 RepID=G0GBG1_WINT7|nr:flavodoxin family protein [Spirochaeta thermophila]AEJ60320.1 hypothetical protein Spith_0033 [Spirochaeta thermophila DSM 6578]